LLSDENNIDHIEVSVNTENNILYKKMAKVNLTNEIKTIELFYDARCGMCCTFMEWLERQERACETICLDYQSDEAKKRFPEILHYEPDKQMVSRVNDEVIHYGGESWVCCLWSCARYRWLAKLLNSRLLLPMAKKVCYLISRNRLWVSKVFFRKKNADIKCKGGCDK
jgi:predicted DCC family thiol-disulfide oxidoreductase YuxK